MPTPTDLPTRLRGAVAKLRTTSMPLADMIPLMQQTADAVERLQAENQALRADSRRFEFWFGTRTKTLDMNEYLLGVRERWPVDRWRAFVDAALKDHP